MFEDSNCPICGYEKAKISPLTQDDDFLYECPNCGEYFIGVFYKDFYTNDYDKKQLQNYLFYNHNHNVAYIAHSEIYKDVHKPGFPTLYNLTPEMVENWYPKTFAEKIDKILLWIGKKSKFLGDTIIVNLNELQNLFFMFNDLQSSMWHNEFWFTMKYLYKSELIIKQFSDIGSIMANFEIRKFISFSLTEKGWTRVDELQKAQSNNKKVFVAMKFGKETLNLRNIIIEAISKAGFKPIFIDKEEFNGQIVPEMLYQIRQCRFMVAELSHHNNGAYYEAGYAAGFGKDVIQICSKEALNSDLHFDVKQVNTITYNENQPEEIIEKLIKRIEATIH